jgi:hypothetical protein
VLKMGILDSMVCSDIVDTIQIGPFPENSHINPTLFLAFIEGVLGFSLVHTNGSTWLYRVDAILKPE